MVEYGLTNEGFVLKRLPDIKEDVETNLRDSFGDINVEADSVFGQLIGVFSRQIAESWEQMENIYNAMYPATAEGVPLDNSASLVGVERLQATASTAIVQMLGSESTVIPLATTFSQSVNLKTFETIIVKTITKADVHKIVVAVDTAQSSTTYTITIDGTDVNLFTGSGSYTKADIADGLTQAINLHSTVKLIVEATYVTGDEFLTITMLNTSSSTSFSSLLSALLSFDEIWSPVSVVADDAGSNPAPINSIDTIDTPVAGLSGVINLSDGTTGRDLETDSAFRLRRSVSLDVISASTLGAIQSRLLQELDIVTASFIFENRTDVVDSAGRPPHSFEAVVAALDNPVNNQLIGEKIWELKPAGINTFGDTSITVIDSNGDNQIVNFNHSETKLIWVELTYDRTGSDNEFPVNGEVLIQNEILRIGETLTFGSDVLVQVFEATGYVAGGVTGVDVRVKFDGGSYQSTNLTIAAANIASFDEARITLIDGTS